MQIALIGEAELQRVKALALIIWPAHYTPLIGAHLVAGIVADIYSLPALQADIRERKHTYWLASLDGKDVGYASAYLEGGRLWLKKLYLLPEARGLGLGKQFIEVARQHFGRHYPQALYVSDKNLTAINFYRAQGFGIERLEPVSMGPYKFHDYVMERPGASA